MKKAMAIVLISMLLLCLSACGKKKTEGAQKGGSNTATEQSSAPEREEGINTIDAGNIEEEAIEIDLETGKVIADPNKDKTASSKESSSGKTDAATSSDSADGEKTASPELNDWEPLR
ncbi:MAG: hypothetical protein IKI29_02750 [Clostridia bacterium]|nr:hypothetical protein [Clostridia bacterium]